MSSAQRFDERGVISNERQRRDQGEPRKCRTCSGGQCPPAAKIGSDSTVHEFGAAQRSRADSLRTGMWVAFGACEPFLGLECTVRRSDRDPVPNRRLPCTEQSLLALHLHGLLFATLLVVALGACAGQTEPGGSPGTGGNSSGAAGSTGPGSAGNGSAAGSGTGGTTAGTSGTTGGSVAGGGGITTGSGGGNGGSTSGGGGASGTAGAAGSTGGSGGAVGAAGSGGSAAGTGGGASGRGGAAGATAGRGGSAGTGSGGSGTAGSGTGGSAAGGTGAAATFQKAAGTIPNSAQPSSKINLAKANWQMGLISPSMQVGHQVNQPTVINGYLAIGGNEEFWIYDVSNPAAPKQLSSFTTPSRTGAEAESHTVSYARYGDTFYMVTIGGKGVNIWDVTSPTAPKHIKAIAIPGTSYGDYTEAVWGVSWQGQYIYIGATNNGIKVIDAANPASAAIVKEVPTSAYGGVSAGPVDAIGNVLVVMTPKDGGGVATLDISDPLNPVRLASTTTDKAYIGMFHRHYVFFIGLKSFDVLSNPKSIASLGSLPTEGSEYMSFQDDYMFLGHVRTEIGGTPGASKITVDDPRGMNVESRIWGRINLGD